MISDADRHTLADLQRRYQDALADADALRMDYYRTLIGIAEDATYDEIAAVLGVSKPRVGQLIAQARRAVKSL